MLTFGKLQLSNYIYFDQAEFDFDYEGITVINGLNRNSLSRNRSNGSGKSTLVRAIPSFFLGSTPGTLESRVKTKRDGFYRKDASLTLSWSDGQHDYVGRKFAKNASTLSYQITRDKTDMAFTTATAAEDWLRSAFPLNEEQIYSTFYLDSKRESVLFSNGTRRFQFLCDMFGLNEADIMREHFMQVKASLRDEHIKLTSLEDRLEEIAQDIEQQLGILNGVDDQEIERRQRHLDRAKRRATQLKQALRLIEEHQDAQQSKYDPKLEQRLLRQQAKLSKQLAEHRAWLQWRHLNKQHHKRQTELLDKRKKLIKQLPELSEDARPRKVRALREKYALEWKDKQQQLQRFLADKRLRAELTQALAKLDKVKYSAKKAKQLLDKAREELTIAKAEKQRLEHITDGQCPTCGSEFDPKKIKRQLAELADRLKTLNQRCRTLSSTRELAVQRADIERQLAELSVKPVDKTQAYALKDKLQLFIQLQVTDEILEDIPDLKQPANAVKHDEDQLNRRLRQINRKLEEQAMARQTVPLGVLLSKLGFKSVAEVEETQRKLKLFDLNKMTTQLMTHSSAWTRLTDLRAEQAKLKVKQTLMIKQQRKVKIIDALITAFGKSGLKRVVAAEYAARLEHRLNSLSGLMFDDKMKFHLEVTPTNFVIAYEDRRGTPFDVRLLSGGEGRSFAILGTLALLSELPSYQRTNLLVLDEMNVNLDEAAKRMFANDLVPALAEIIPHIIVVSPTDEVYPNSRRVIVEKHKERGRLIYEN